MSVPAARLAGVTKRFGRVVALDRADVELRPGEVHALLGENGAGKSTLLGILGGGIAPDAGTVEVGGRALPPGGPRAAWRAGVGLVHQHFTLVPAFSVIENLALGSRGASHGLRLAYGSVRERTRELARRAGLGVDLEARTGALGVGERQRVEILKVLLRDPRVLALDEPTAVLTPPEVDGLFSLVRGLASEGRAVVLVTHKLDEALTVADRVTVLRGGRTVVSAPRSEVDAAALSRAMVGADGVADAALHGTAVGHAREDRWDVAEVVATLRDVAVVGHPGVRDVLDGVSLEVRRGEIVGVVGVVGNGQRELCLVLAGRLPPDRGTARVPSEIGFIPQDRTREGLVAPFDLTENAALALHRLAAYRRGPLLRWRALRAGAAELVARFDVRAPRGLGTPAAALSGGNQQRLVVAREFELAHDLLVAENPTRGLDVRAAAFVRDRLVRLARAASPPGVVLVSTDIDEVLGLADRVLVQTRGRLVPVPPERRGREAVGRLMLAGGGAARAAGGGPGDLHPGAGAGVADPA